METRATYPCEIEIRRRGDFSEFRGSFPFRSLATVRDRGRVRKETFLPGAFDFALRDETREIHLLSGHELSKPLASRKAGTLEIVSDGDALRFRGKLPDPERQTTWMRDAVLAAEAGLIGGVSPGFKVPPKSAVPDAETLEPEPGNPGVMIRTIRQAVLFELSLVSRAAYPDTELSLRDDADAVADLRNRRLFMCL